MKTLWKATGIVLASLIGLTALVVVAGPLAVLLPLGVGMLYMGINFGKESMQDQDVFGMAASIFAVLIGLIGFAVIGAAMFWTFGWAGFH